MPGNRNKRWLEKYGPWGASPRPWLPDERDYDTDELTNLCALVFVVLLVLFSVWVLHRFQQASQQTDCFLSGHRNCMPIDDGGS